MSRDPNPDLRPPQRSSQQDTRLEASPKPLPNEEEYLLELVRKFLRLFQDQQRILLQMREGVVQGRVNLRLTDGAIRKKRLKAGDAEAEFMKSLRRLYITRNEIFPPELQEQYQLVQELRDDIGKTEDDSMQDDRIFNISEWEMLEKENEFYDMDALDLFEEQVLKPLRERLAPNDDRPAQPPSASSSPPQPPTTEVVMPETNNDIINQGFLSALAEVGKLTAQFNKFREEEVGHMEERRLRMLAEFSTPPETERYLREFYERASIILDRLIAAENELQRWKQQMYTEGHNPNVERRASDPLYIFSQRALPTRPSSSRAWTDSAVSNLVSDFSSVKQRIGIWMLESLHESPLEWTRFKTLLKSLRTENLDEDSWLQIVKHWNDDITSSPLLHEHLESPSASHQTAHAVGSVTRKTVTEGRPDVAFLASTADLYDEVSEDLTAVLPLNEPAISLTEPQDQSGGHAVEHPVINDPQMLADSAISLPPPLPLKDSCQPSPVMEASCLHWPHCKTKVISDEVDQESPASSPGITPTQETYPDVVVRSHETALAEIEEAIQSHRTLFPNERPGRTRPQSEPGGPKQERAVAEYLATYDGSWHRDRQPRTPPLDPENTVAGIPTVNEPSHDVPSPPETVDYRLSRSPSPLEFIPLEEVLQPYRLVPLNPHRRRAHSEIGIGNLAPHARKPDRPSR